jgi:short-subunit dehydrogenase
MPIGDFNELSFRAIQDTLNINCYSFFQTTHVLFKKLRERAGGAPAAIINIGSYTHRLCLPQTTVYAATKAAVAQFSKAL